MKLWMDIQRDLEGVMYDHERILDAWKEGGVDGVVFGPLVFGTAKLSQRAQSLPSDEPVAPVYDPNPAVYERLGAELGVPVYNVLPYFQEEADNLWFYDTMRGRWHQQVSFQRCQALCTGAA